MRDLSAKINRPSAPFMVMALSALLSGLPLAGLSAATAGSPQPVRVDQSASPLRVEKHFYGLNRPVRITIDSRSAQGANTLEIVLLDQPGAVIVEPVNVAPGTGEGLPSLSFDLSERMPSIWSIRRACYLQLLRDGEPTGAPLVIQPMLSRLTMWTQRDVRPDGRTPYTRIVGWGAKPKELERRDDDAADVPGDDPLEVQETPIFSGLRIYPERDAVLATELGEMRFAMRPDEAPNTVWNFLTLVEGGYYDGVPFHRIVPATRQGHPFVIQAGDPSGTGSGGPGYWLPMEHSRLPHDFGVLSMARADDPDSAGGQFFVCLSREGTARLDGQYCAFGYAVGNGRAIIEISEVELEDVNIGRAAQPPLIVTASLVPAPPRVPGRGRSDRPALRDNFTPDQRQPTRVPR